MAKTSPLKSSMKNVLIVPAKRGIKGLQLFLSKKSVGKLGCKFVHPLKDALKVGKRQITTHYTLLFFTVCTGFTNPIWRIAYYLMAVRHIGFVANTLSL